MTPPPSSPASAATLRIDTQDWAPVVAGQAELRLSSVGAQPDAALRLDFDFHGGGGFVVARRPLQRRMGEAYAVQFLLRGDVPRVALELKLADERGGNVWRYVIPALRVSRRWRRYTIPNHAIDFAWGPAHGATLTALGALEFAIVAADGSGGAGWLEIGELAIVDDDVDGDTVAAASSGLPGRDAAQALTSTGWQPRAADPAPWLQLDVQRVRRFGGIVIDWDAAAPARGFCIRTSTTGTRWTTRYQTTQAGGARSAVALPAAKFRYLRLELRDAGVGARVQLKGFAFSQSPEAFWQHVAAMAPRGAFPRWLLREQCLWTPVGTPRSGAQALIDADGRVEFAPGSAMIEPMLQIDDRLYTWADVEAQPALRAGWMPQPSVRWQTPAWALEIAAEATASDRLRVRYRLTPRGGAPLAARLFVLIRPFQVSPPWQQHGALGGVRPIRRLAWHHGVLQMDDSGYVRPLTRAARFAGLRAAEGSVAAALARLPESQGASDQDVSDADGFATGVLVFEMNAAAGSDAAVVLTAAATREQLADADAPALDWSGDVPTAMLAAAGDGMDAIRAAWTAAAHILVTRDGAALQPGPRRYRRSWIRDGAVMGAALLRMNQSAAVGDFIRWYAPYVRADGFVPCCVDANGADPLVEHDSHGQWLALIAEHQRFAPDAALLGELWPSLARTVECIAGLLDATGLLPVSASHEGYLAQPVHSYWDDAWAVRGLRDLAALAQAHGRDALARRCDALQRRLADALFASIAATRAQRALDFIPGSLEWADFDPTATATLLTLLDLPPPLDRGAVEQTYARYLADWRRKRRNEVDWANYTPYEIRIIGALVRLGWRDAALELLRFFLADRRPLAWNQWPEIAWRDAHAPAHLGDLPHTWIAAEYVLALHSLFAYESETQDALVLAAGVDADWLAGDGLRVRGLPTPRGALSYTLRRLDERTLQCEIAPGIRGALVLRPPLAGTITAVRVNDGRRLRHDAASVTIDALATPVQLRIHTDR